MYAIKVELKLNNKERTLMAQHAGFARLVYNYGLYLYESIDHKQYKGGVDKKLGIIKKILTNYTKKQSENAWMNQMSSRVYQHALMNLATAYKNYFKGLGDYPVMKRKKDKQSFTVDSSNGVVL